MFELKVLGLRQVGLRIGDRYFRTWRPFSMDLPDGYESSLTAYLVEWHDDRDGNHNQLGAFMSSTEAEACRAQLETEGWRDLVINVVPVHSRLEDWQFDR